jgi:hypothetical protein
VWRLTSVLLLAFFVPASCGALRTGQGPNTDRVTSPSQSPGTCPTGTPAARESPAATYDLDRHITLVFGGDVAGASTSDTLVYSSGCWSAAQVVVAPSPRQSAALAYDPDLHLSLLVGGRKDDPKGAQTIPGDAWTWNGQAWNQLIGAPHFSDAVAAYDPQHHLVVVLGAAPEGVGTWTWNGSEWHFVTAQGPGLPRGNPAFCFDTANGNTVLFGGAGSGTPILGDTWLWNGSAWRKQQPLHNPQPRFEAAMSCGPNPVLFGGWGSYSGLALTDTWSWSGADWQESSTAHRPAVQGGMPFAIYDGTRRLLFAGMRPDQIWTWTGTEWVNAM